MVVGLSTGQELGIAAVAAVFILFALAVSFLAPRRNPDFPGRGLRWFVLVVALLFVAMMGAIVALAREDEEAEGHGATPTEESAGGEAAGGGELPGGGEGDVEDGRAVFTEAGCGSCHALEEAGTTAAVGPDLDQSQVSYEQAVTQIREGGGGMPPFGDQLSEEQIRNVAAFVVASRG